MGGDPSVRRHVWIEGRVQGVWFRETCRRQAAQQRVTGWVRNCPDGRVEAVFEGHVADVATMVEWCRSGPPRAVVTEVDVSAETPVGEVGFAVR